jgi:hypothetical protein
MRLKFYDRVGQGRIFRTSGEPIRESKYRPAQIAGYATILAVLSAILTLGLLQGSSRLVRNRNKRHKQRRSHAIRSSSSKAMSHRTFAIS